MMTSDQPTQNPRKARKRLPCGCWVAIAVVFFYGYLTFEVIPYPKEVRLFDLGTGSAAASIAWPYGELHQLILGIPGSVSHKPPEFKGTVSFFDGGRLVKKQEVSSSNADSCNWLDSDGYPWAFILTWPNDNGWDAGLRPGHRLTIKADIKGDLPKGSSLWLSLLQNGQARLRTSMAR